MIPKTLIALLATFIVVLSAGIAMGDDAVQDNPCSDRIVGTQGIKLKPFVVEDGNVKLTWEVKAETDVDGLQAKDIRIWRRVRNDDTMLCSAWVKLKMPYERPGIHHSNDEFWDVTPLVGIEPIKYQYTIELRRGIGLNQIVDPGKANWDVANSFISQVRGIKIKYEPKTPADMHVYVNKRYLSTAP